VAASEQRRIDLHWDVAERIAQRGLGIPEFVPVAGSAPIAGN
jgi:hypothetical protein